jgi:hypothetical protein
MFRFNRRQPRSAATIAAEINDLAAKLALLTKELEESLKPDDDNNNPPEQPSSDEESDNEGTNLVGRLVKVTVAGQYHGVIAKVLSRRGTQFWWLEDTSSGKVFYKMEKSFELLPN